MSGKPPLNIDTVLLAILVALSGWTLKTVHELTATVAVLATRADLTDRAVSDVRAQGQANTVEISNLRVRTARQP